MSHADRLPSCFALVLVAVAALFLGGCTSGSNIAGTYTGVYVTLGEFSVTPDRNSAPYGHIEFHVTNSGTLDHDFMVIRTDLAADALPTNADGSYQQNGAGTVVLSGDSGEFSDVVHPGAPVILTRYLRPGHYVLISSTVAGGASDYSRGMRAGLTVN